MKIVRSSITFKFLFISEISVVAFWENSNTNNRRHSVYDINIRKFNKSLIVY